MRAVQDDETEKTMKTKTTESSKIIGCRKPGETRYNRCRFCAYNGLPKTCENCINYTRNDGCTVKKEYKFKNETCEQWTGK